MILWLSSAARAQTDSARVLLLKGSKLADTEADKLEEKVATNPDDPMSHILLIGYYEHIGQGNFDLSKRDHVLWLIRHYPTSEIVGLPEGRLSPVLDPIGYFQGRDLWLKQVNAQKGDRVVILNAAGFLNHDDTSKIAESILKLASEARPDDYDWQERLARYYLLSLGSESGSTRKATAAESLRIYLRTINLMKATPVTAYSSQTKESKNLPPEFVQMLHEEAIVERDIRLAEVHQDAAWAAFESDQKDRAQSLSIESLSICHRLLGSGKFGHGDLGVFLAPAYDDLGEALHRGNLILCKISLVEGNMVSAKKYLIESANTPGSPVLKSFGPDMSLAKEMLKRDERDIVIKYLELCSKFWKSHREDIPIWVKAIKNRKTPDFGIAESNDRLAVSRQSPEFWNNKPNR